MNIQRACLVFASVLTLSTSATLANEELLKLENGRVAEVVGI
jgi:hypothetical protein